MKLINKTLCWLGKHEYKMIITVYRDKGKLLSYPYYHAECKHCGAAL